MQNLERVRLGRALEVLLGLCAQGNVRLGRDWFDALARHPAQAEALEWQVNSRRSEAAAMSRSSLPR